MSASALVHLPALLLGAFSEPSRSRPRRRPHQGLLPADHRLWPQLLAAPPLRRLRRRPQLRLPLARPRRSLPQPVPRRDGAAAPAGLAADGRGAESTRGGDHPPRAAARVSLAPRWRMHYMARRGKVLRGRGGSQSKTPYVRRKGGVSRGKISSVPVTTLTFGNPRIQETPNHPKRWP